MKVDILLTLRFKHPLSKKVIIPIIYELSSLADRIAFDGLQGYVRFNFNMAEWTKFDIVVTCDRYMGVAHLQLQNTIAILFLLFTSFPSF